MGVSLAEMAVGQIREQKGTVDGLVKWVTYLLQGNARYSKLHKKETSLVQEQTVKPKWQTTGSREIINFLCYLPIKLQLPTNTLKTLLHNTFAYQGFSQIFHWKVLTKLASELVTIQISQDFVTLLGIYFQHQIFEKEPKINDKFFI